MIVLVFLISKASQVIFLSVILIFPIFFSADFVLVLNGWAARYFLVKIFFLKFSSAFMLKIQMDILIYCAFTVSILIFPVVLIFLSMGQIIGAFAG